MYKLQSVLHNHVATLLEEESLRAKNRSLATEDVSRRNTGESVLGQLTFQTNASDDDGEMTIFFPMEEAEAGRSQ